MSLPNITLLIESTTTNLTSILPPPPTISASSPARTSNATFHLKAHPHSGVIACIPAITLPLRAYRATAVHHSTLATYTSFLQFVEKLYQTCSRPVGVYVYHPVLKSVVEVGGWDIEKVWEDGAGWRYIFIVGTGSVSGAQMFASRSFLSGEEGNIGEKDMRERRYMVVLSNEWEAVVDTGKSSKTGNSRGLGSWDEIGNIAFDKEQKNEKLEPPSTPTPTTPQKPPLLGPKTPPPYLPSPQSIPQTPTSRPENTLPAPQPQLPIPAHIIHRTASPPSSPPPPPPHTFTPSFRPIYAHSPQPSPAAVATGALKPRVQNTQLTAAKPLKYIPPRYRRHPSRDYGAADSGGDDNSSRGSTSGGVVIPSGVGNGSNNGAVNGNGIINGSGNGSPNSVNTSSSSLTSSLGSQPPTGKVKRVSFAVELEKSRR